MNKKEEIREEFHIIYDLLEQINFMYQTGKNEENEYKITEEFLLTINEFVSKWMNAQEKTGKFFNQLEEYIEEMVEPVIGMTVININSIDEKFQRVSQEKKYIVKYKILQI